eukprot:TRINITY_DN5635_c0_g1_i6.p1 TRINITY_DN5635_c0_g1~~TRINITY_DN5635_c0_g1_i6.p1  ORF type:complete len:177 (-),score=28.94 TRINITY_DN5635_c0_g1_i6:137-667(-)
MRLEYEKLNTHPEIVEEGGRFHNNPRGFALHRYAYYLCFKCQKPYYGGLRECAEARGSDNFDPSELMCAGCSPLLTQECPKHGKDYLEFKCRFCCSVAVWFCFGTTHFCEPCHQRHSPLTRMNKHDHPQCPVGYLPGHNLPVHLPDRQDCPLGVKHPPTGEEFHLGCGLCRNLGSF